MKQQLLDEELPSFARKHELPIPHNALALEGASAYWRKPAKLYQIFLVHAGIKYYDHQEKPNTRHKQSQTISYFVVHKT